MNISSISGTSGTYARKPAEPTPPPEGNLENRRPPPPPELVRDFEVFLDSTSGTQSSDKC